METYAQIQDIKRAILRGDSDYNGIKLPKAQTTGTAYQIESYAQLQAQRVYNQF